MSSKNAKSIHSHLIYHYCAAIIILFALLSLAFYLESTNVINQADYDFVADEVNNIQYILSENPMNLELLKHTVLNKPTKNQNSLYRYYVRIFDEKRRVLIETPGIPRANIVRDQGYSWKTDNGSKYLIIQAPAKLARHVKSGWIQVMMDTSYQQTKSHQRRIYIFILLIATALSILLVIAITRRGLYSINTLTNLVSNITTTSLGKRVDTNSLPKELITLGTAFNKMLNHIEESFNRITQISADMSHELRTPITNLIGQTEVLLSYDHSIDDFRQAQMSNLEELQRMSSMIENILFLARSENANQQLTKTIIHVAHEFEIVCEYYEASAEEKNIRINAAGDATLLANPIMFRRLLNNIISNAVKYTPENGEIWINAAEFGSSVIITVQDNGIGIPAIHLPRIFDRFYRVDSARSIQIGGSGLGLAIAKAIVDQHAGTITITSELNKGVLVTITLPK